MSQTALCSSVKSVCSSTSPTQKPGSAAGPLSPCGIGSVPSALTVSLPSRMVRTARWYSGVVP